MMYCISVLLLILSSFFLQEFCPVLPWAYDSRLLLVHAIFFAAAVSVPFPVMLLFALISGFVWDSRYYIPIHSLETGGNGLEIPFGFTIFVFGLFGAFIQGVRPFFRQGRWELPVLMVGVCTLGGQLLEYLIICFNRGGIITSMEFWMKILMTSLYSMLLAPFLLLLFSRLAGMTGFKIQMDGITRRYSYDGDAV
ncbi:MAG: hypothetical protein P1V20_01065 [Verrucomicrobiales bacterium]|nr:hypothetical protein [Verrucomicrobiales bacterium]